MIRRFILLSVLLLQFGHVQSSDPDILCKTRTATIPVADYKHCEKGDLVQIEEYEVARQCILSEPVIVLGQRVLCKYRGERRNVRERPLSDVEKAYDEEQVDRLVDKYTD